MQRHLKGLLHPALGHLPKRHVLIAPPAPRLKEVVIVFFAKRQKPKLAQAAIRVNNQRALHTQSFLQGRINPKSLAQSTSPLVGNLNQLQPNLRLKHLVIFARSNKVDLRIRKVHKHCPQHPARNRNIGTNRDPRKYKDILDTLGIANKLARLPDPHKPLDQGRRIHIWKRRLNHSSKHMRVDIHQPKLKRIGQRFHQIAKQRNRPFVRSQGLFNYLCDQTFRLRLARQQQAGQLASGSIFQR